MGYFKFISIFESNIIKNAPSQIIIDDSSKIEFFSESRSYNIPIQTASIMPVDQSYKFSESTSLVLPEGKYYIVITSRTKENNPYIANKMCENSIDNSIAYLSLIYSPGMFDKVIYRGWLIENEHFIADAWIKIEQPINIQKDIIEANIKNIKKHQKCNPELEERFVLMARFYSKAALLKPSEEKLLFLWTILEIFPMQNTSNIKPISDYLAQYMKRKPEIIKEKLEIGKFFGIRSNLVHDGKLVVPFEDWGEKFKKLEEICTEIMRCCCGLELSGELEKYFD